MFVYPSLTLLISWLNSPPVLIVPFLLGTLYVWSCFLVCTFISEAIQYLSSKFAFTYIVHNRLSLLQLETNKTNQRGWGMYPLWSILETRLIKYEHRLSSWCISSGAGPCFNPEYLLWGNFNEISKYWLHFLSTKRSRHWLCITLQGEQSGWSSEQEGTLEQLLTQEMEIHRTGDMVQKQRNCLLCTRTNI